MPSGGASRGSTTTKGKPCRCSMSSSSGDSSGSIRIAPSVVPRISRSSSETSRSCSCSVGASTSRMSALVESLRRAAQHRAEIGVGDERQRQADHPRAPAREPAGPAVRAETVLAHDLQHALPGLLRHVRPVVQDPRDGRDRDAGEVGDVPDRGAAAERRDGLGVGLSHSNSYSSTWKRFRQLLQAIFLKFAGFPLDIRGRSVVTVTGNYRKSPQIDTSRPSWAGKEGRCHVRPAPQASALPSRSEPYCWRHCASSPLQQPALPGIQPRPSSPRATSAS